MQFQCLSTALFISLLVGCCLAGNPNLMGGPGLKSFRDRFNSGDWNKTYAPNEPQQIHLSWLSDGTACRLQFVTLEMTEQVHFTYWQKQHSDEQPVWIQHETRQSRAFVDGGQVRRTIFLHNFKSNPLEPGTTYEYKVGATLQGKTMWSKVYEFHTPGQGVSFDFLAAGDMGVVNAVSMPIFKNSATSQKYDFMAFLGDMGYDMADFDGRKGDEYMNYVQDIYARLPVMTTPGNHEAAYNFTHYKNRFGIVPYQESDSPSPTLYSFNYKSLHLVSYSSEVYFEGTPEEVQTAEAWLEKDLTQANQARGERPWIVVIAHRPFYCTPVENEDCAERARLIRDRLEPIFIKHKIDLYLTGHRHNYQRTYPIANSTRLTTSYHNPPSYFQVVSGNAGNYEGPDPILSEKVKDPEWSAFQYRGYGFTSITVNPSSMLISHWESRQDGTKGKLIDAVIVTKDRQRRRHRRHH